MEKKAASFEAYINDIAKIAKKEPEWFFQANMEDMSIALKDANDKLVTSRLAKLQDAASNEVDEEKHKALDAQYKETKKLYDSYSNDALMLGAADTFSVYDSYDINGMLYNWYLWTSMYMSSWVFARAIDKPATDMIRNGWSITLIDPPIANVGNIAIAIKQAFDKKKFNIGQKNIIQDIIKLIKWGKLYGGAVICILTDVEDIDTYKTELTLDELKNKKWRLLVADRWQSVFPSTEMVTNVSDPDYNTPKEYRVVTDSGSFTFHHTRVARYVNGDAPLMISRLLMGWGIPEGVRLFNELNRDERIKNMITSLLSKASLEVIKMPGMHAYLTGQLTPEMENELDQRLSLLNRYRHYNNLMFMDKDDEYQRLDGTSLGSLSQLVDSNARFVAGAVPMPQVLLYGDQQKGLSGNNFDDMMVYEDNLMTQRHEKLTGVITRVSKWLCWSQGFDYTEFEITFNSSIQETPAQKIDRQAKVLEFKQKLISMGLTTIDLVKKDLSGDQTMDLGTLVSDEAIDDTADKDKKSKEADGLDLDFNKLPSGSEIQPMASNESSVTPEPAINNNLNQTEPAPSVETNETISANAEVMKSDVKQ